MEKNTVLVQRLKTCYVIVLKIEHINLIINFNDERLMQYLFQSEKLGLAIYLREIIHHCACFKDSSAPYIE